MKTKTKKQRILPAGWAGALVLLVTALGGDGATRALEPCPSFRVVRLTGTLLDVRQGDVVVPNEQAILDGVPRAVCVSPTNTSQPTTSVTVADCDFPESFVNVMLGP